MARASATVFLMVLDEWLPLRIHFIFLDIVSQIDVTIFPLKAERFTELSLKTTLVFKTLQKLGVCYVVKCGRVTPDQI